MVAPADPTCDAALRTAESDLVGLLVAHGVPQTLIVVRTDAADSYSSTALVHLRAHPPGGLEAPWDRPGMHDADHMQLRCIELPWGIRPTRYGLVGATFCIAPPDGRHLHVAVTPDADLEHVADVVVEHVTKFRHLSDQLPS